MRVICLHDKTQELLSLKLAQTENMLSRVLKKINTCYCNVEITLLEDLGFSNNFTRMKGGFFTGINVCWESNIPFIPVDTTINACGVSIFRFEGQIDGSDFQDRIDFLLKNLEQNGIKNNFNNGNHFISLCEDDNGYQYLVLHASENKYKYGNIGLYPRDDTWYYDQIQTENFDNGYIRYLIGDPAEAFLRIYKEAEKSNPIRNRLVAEVFLRGCDNIEEVLYVPHYGMPNINSVSIGSQWSEHRFVLLSRLGADIYILSQNNPTCIYTPHGFGLSIKGECSSLSFADHTMVVNGIEIDCNGGFLNSGIAETRNSNSNINIDLVKAFLPSRSINVHKVLKQRCSYSKHGISSFE